MVGILVLSLAVPTFALIPQQVNAEDLTSKTILTNNEIESQVNNMVRAINDKDWEEFTNIMYSEEQQFYTQYFNDDDLTNGIKQVDSVKLAGIYEIQDTEAKEEWLDTEYSVLEKNDHAVSSIIELDCNVSKENQYFINGVNYFHIVWVEEDGTPKIVQFNRPSAKLIHLAIDNEEIKVENTNEIKAVQVLDAAEKGMVINADGDFLTDGFEVKSSTNEDGIMLMTDPPILNKYTNYSCPTQITVMLKNAGNQVKTIDFNEYVENCVYNEWPADSPTNAYKVGAYCCKMVGWYRTINPASSSGAYDTTTDQQNYVLGNPAPQTVKTVVNNIKNKGFANSDSRIFFPYHVAGVKGQAGTKACGKVSQYGSVYWVQQGKDVQWILNYYYKGSEFSSGNVVIFNY